MTDGVEPPAAPASSAGAPTPQTPEASHFLRLMALCDDAMFSVLHMEDDGACTVLYVSPGVTQLLGYTPAEYLALGPIYMAEAIHPDDVERVLRETAEARAAPPAWRTVRYREARKDASWADIESLYTTRGRLFYGITRDATGARATERALKDLLLSTSFDLRCAATSIMSASSLLRSRPAVLADAETSELADAVRTSCDMLAGLASNVLELRRLERGELRVQRAPFCLRDTVRGVLQMCRMAKCGGADLIWEDEAAAANALPPLVEGDPVLTALILQNLVTNALKFCNNSPVSVRVTLEPKAKAQEPKPTLAQDEEEPPPTMRTLRVDVADQGVGVAPEDQERVFQKYERAAPQAGGGAGLGLHLCRSFARAMDGDVSLASALGRGATFTLRVPVRVLAPDEAPPPSGDAAAAACKPAAPAPDLFGRVLANQAAGRLPAVDPFAEVSLEEMVQHYLREAREVFAFSAPLSGEQDRTPVLAYVSPSVRTVLGWEPEQLLGSTGVSLLHPDDVDKHAGSAAALWAAEGRCVYGMRRVRRADGSYLWMHMEMNRAGDAGNIHYSLWRDATSFKESQSSLKEYLLATSHDMRTPVTGIVTAAQLLEARPCVRADAEASFLVQSIKSCGGLMDSVISNVMQLRSLDDLEDVEAACVARDVLQPVPFDPRTLVSDVLLATCTAMGHNCRRLGISQPAALPACVVADRERLQRTVQNVLICLLRHSTDDRQLSIRLACERSSGAAALGAAVPSEADDETAELQLDLSDAARDVAPEAFELMFAPYFSSKTPDAGGLHSGLGLCVARAFARAMGGSLAAERVAPPGVMPSGIAIRLRLPVHVPAGGAETARQLKRAAPGASTPKARYSNTLTALPAASEAPGAPGQKRILLVEDHELILKLVSKLLRSAGFEVSTAVNGAEALQQLQAAATLPDAVLTDIQMPMMDGLQFARAFRAWEATRLPPGAPRLPVIALSANVLDEHVQQSYDAGMTCHFAKPLRPDAVQELRGILHCADDDAPTSLPQ